MTKRYSPKLKFQVVLEVLSGERSVAQIAKAYGVHPNSVNAWKRAFLDKGPELFSQDSEVKAYERRVAELERLLGQKEVEIALLEDWLGQGN